MGDGRFGEAKSGDHPGSRPARHALPFPLAEGPFWFHKGDVPYCSSLEGLLVEPNIIEVSVANHECRDKEHEYITCVSFCGRNLV